jgi:hypothetical protein
MNAAMEVTKMLNEHGAVLIRQNKHLVYRLPNGRVFTRVKTPSDHRTPLNELSDLRRALGVERPMPPSTGGPERHMPTTETPAPVSATPVRARTPAVTEDGPKETLKERIDAAIAQEESAQERLLVAAQAHERRVHLMKALLPFADDPATEEALRALLPAFESPRPAPEPPRPEPPQVVTERVQVTRQLVFAATQTFDDPFTVNDVMARMTGGAVIDGQERQRVRSSIAGAMMALLDRGEVLRVAEGFGKRQAVWKKAALNGGGNGQGVRA